MSTQLLGSLLVRLGLESGAFKSGLDASTKQFRQAQKQFEKIGASMANVGKNLTLGVTLPMIALGAQAVKGAKDQAQAMAQVEAALTSMGNVSGKTSAELAKTADALEMKSLVDADVILTKVTANLLTFGNVAGQVFDRAQQAALDMAQRMGSDPQAAAIMLGKALNDPIKGITALTRVGVQFTDAQKKQIKAFQDGGQAAKAQGIILDEVERQFAGAAEAAANTEPLRKAEVAWNQAMDKIGEAILPLIPKISAAIEQVAAAFTNLSPSAQSFILVAAGIVTALGPVIFILGNIVKLAAPMAAAFTTISAAAAASGAAAGGASAGFAALTAAAAPWLAVAAAVAAVGYLIYENWDKIAPVLAQVWEALSSALGPPLQKIISTISTMLTELWNGPLGEWLGTVVSQLGTLAGAFLRTFGPVLIAILQAAFTVIGNLLETLLEVGRAVGALFSGDLDSAFQHFGRAINALFMGLPSKIIGWMAQLVTGVRSWLVDKLNAVWDWVIGKVQAVGQAFYRLYDAVVGHSYIPDMVDQIGVHMRRLDKEMVEPAKKNASKAEEAFRQLKQNVAGILADLFPEQRERLDLEGRVSSLNQYYDALKKEAKLKTEIAAIDEQRTRAIDAAERKYLGLDRDNTGILAGANTVDIEAVAGGKSIEEMSEDISDRMGDAFGKVKKDADVMKVSVVESFGQMFDSLTGQIDRFVSGIKNGDWLDAIGGLLSAVESIGKIISGNSSWDLGSIFKPEARATGGPVMSGRPYIVGEEGPELFSPRMSGSIIPNEHLGGGIAQIIPSPYFDVVVDGRIVRAGPSLVQAGSADAQASMARGFDRRLA